MAKFFFLVFIVFMVIDDTTCRWTAEEIEESREDKVEEQEEWREDHTWTAEERRETGGSKSSFKPRRARFGKLNAQNDIVEGVVMPG